MTSTRSAGVRRIAVATVLMLGLAAAGLIGAGAAAAHVTVASPGAAPGSYATVTFKVPTESETASTTSLRVQFPTEAPVASVSVQPMPGWSYHVTKTKLPAAVQVGRGEITEAVSEIVWTAATAATAIRPGEFNQFVISAGPLPAAGSMTFKAIQYYSDNTVVKWIEVAAPGSTTVPDHPAPVLKLAAASGSDSHDATPSAAASATATATVPASSDDSGKATTAIALGALGTLLGALALGLAILRGRRAS